MTTNLTPIVFENQPKAMLVRKDSGGPIGLPLVSTFDMTYDELQDTLTIVRTDQDKKLLPRWQTIQDLLVSVEDIQEVKDDKDRTELGPEKGSESGPKIGPKSGSQEGPKDQQKVLLNKSGSLGTNLQEKVGHIGNGSCNMDHSIAELSTVSPPLGGCHQKTVIRGQSSKRSGPGSPLKRRQSSFLNLITRKACDYLPYLTWPLVTKLAIIVVAVNGLLFQVICESSRYFRYDTVTRLSFENSATTFLPAVTVCLPLVISTEGLKILFPEAADLLDKIKYISGKEIPFWFGDENVTKIGIDPQELRAYYENLAFGRLSVQEMFNASLEAKKIGCIVKGSTDRPDQITSCRPPISSIFEKRKCFTFFDDKVELSSKDAFAMLIVETPKRFLNSDRIAFGFHETGMVATSGDVDFLKLKPRTRYEGRFHRRHSHLLEPPYATRCRHYKEASDGATVGGSQWRCIQKCSREVLKWRCQDCVSRHALVVEGEEEFWSDKWCPWAACQEDYWQARIECQQQCQPDCFQNEYFVTLSELSASSFENSTSVIIRPSRHADIVVKHSPKITFGTYFANLGGLAMIWFLIVVALCSGVDLAEFAIYRAREKWQF